MMKTLTLAALLLGSATAMAQPKPTPGATKTEDQKKTEAKALYDKGITHYNLGEFDPAIAAFREAYAISSAPGLLFNIAQSFRLKKDYEQASYFYATYLRLKPDATNRADVEARIAEMNTMLEQQKKLQNGPPTGTVNPDGEGGTKGPLTNPTTTNLTITPTTNPKTTPASTTVAARTEPAGADTDEPDQGTERPGKTLVKAGIATASVGGALIITGVIFGKLASSAESDLNALNSGGTWTQDAQDKYDAGKRDNSIAMVSLVVGGAAVVAGGTMWFLGNKKSKSANVAIVPTRSGTSVAVGWSF